MEGVGSERVLESNKSDNIFIYHSGHGAPGLLVYPRVNIFHDDYIYADQLM